MFSQGEGRKFLLVVLIFGGLSVTNVLGGDHEVGADNEPSQSHFVGAGTNAAHVGNHGKYFQDFYSLQYGPNQLEFGHVCEDPSTWEQRFERKDMDKNHHQGQISGVLVASLYILSLVASYISLLCVRTQFLKLKTTQTENRCLDFTFSTNRAYFQADTCPQYGHQDKDHYDMGHRRGNEHHFIERHEKGSPHHGHVSTKVRWGDKHGGYGEHYWDYNHAGHHDGGDGDGTAPVAEYAEANEETPQNQESFQNSATQLSPTATATQTRPWQQPRNPSPSEGFTLPKFTSRVNPVKLPKAQVTSASQVNEKVTEGRLPSSWSPIPSLHPSPTRNKPLTAHQLSRSRRSLRLSTGMFNHARKSIEIRETA